MPLDVLTTQDDSRDEDMLAQKAPSSCYCEETLSWVFFFEAQKLASANSCWRLQASSHKFYYCLEDKNTKRKNTTHK